MNYCPKCRKKLVVQDFCVECGADLSEYVNQTEPASLGDLGSFEFSALEQEAARQLVEQSGLEIQGSVLVKYTGKSRTVIIPQGVTEIFDGAFQNNEIIAAVNIPQSVNIIGKSAFEGCKYLKTVTLPSEMEEIYARAFFGCNELEQITIPKKITQIREQVFCGCGGLKSITIPDSVTQIQYNAFQGCCRLNDIYITNLAAWCAIFGLRDLMRPERRITLHLNNTPITRLVIPESVSVIRHSAFSGCGDLVSVSFPKTVRSIEGCAFFASGLQELTIPNYITDIGKNAFGACKGLTSVVISANIPSYYQEESIFFDCPKLSRVTITDSVTSIGTYAFYGCAALTSIELPDSVSTICAFAFEGCSSLASIRLSNAITRIEPGTFRDCSSLSSISIPDSVTTIGREAFGKCKGLTNIQFPNSLSIIETEAFRDCSGIRSIRVPDSVQSIGYGAFCGCMQMEQITLPFVGEKAVNNGYREKHFGFIFGYSGERDAILAEGKKLSYYYSDYSESYEDRIEGTGYRYSIPASLKCVTILGGQSCNFSGCNAIRHIQLPADLYHRSNKSVDFYCCTGPQITLL